MRDSVKTAGWRVIAAAAAAGVLMLAPAAASRAQQGPGGAGASAPTTTGNSSPTQPPAAQSGAAPAAAPNPQQLANQRAQQEVNAVLAERFSEMAQARLRAPTVTDAMVRQAVVLLDATHLLDPADPRYMRFQYEIAMRTGDTAGAIKSLSEYREWLKKYAKVAPEDFRAATILIDLYAGQYQTADAKLAYLAGNADQQGIVQRAGVAPELRSHAAEVAASILLERSKTQAIQMLDQAIRLNPLNASALRMKYSLLDADVKVSERTAVLMDWLRANPAQPAAMGELAVQLGDLGLAAESARWYSLAKQFYQTSGLPLPKGFIAGYTTQLFLLGQSDAASGLLAQHLVQAQGDADAWFVRLAIEQARGNQRDTTVPTQARGQLEQRLTRLCETVAANARAGGAELPEPGAPAASQGAHPDTSAAIRLLTEPTADPQWKAVFASAVSDLAWFEICFGGDLGQAENWIGMLEKVPPADDVTIPRLKGWVHVGKGQPEEARKLLEPIAKKDPLAAAGLVRINPDKKAGDEEAVRLLGEERGGTVAALLWGEFKARNVRPPQPDGAEVKAVAAQVAQFPGGLLQILTQPQAFYQVRIEGFKVAHGYREPIYLQVTIQNTSQYDLTLGPDGVIRSDLLLGARAQLGQQVHEFGALAFDRIVGPAVLKANKSISGQIIRIDQGPLLALLDQLPGATIDVAGYVITNPLTVGQSIQVGPAGQRVQLARKIVRTGFNFQNPASVAKVMQTLQNGVPGEKAGTLELLASHVPALMREAAVNNQLTPQQRQQYQETAQTFLEAIAAKQADPLMAGLAAFEMARVHPDALERAQFVAQMASDAEWTTRLLALEAAPAAGLKPEQQLEIAETMAKRDIQGLPNADGEALLRAFAAAQVDLLKHPPAAAEGPGGGGAAAGPASGPTTGPATGPATVPATGPTSQPTTTGPASRPTASQPAPAVQPSGADQQPGAATPAPAPKPAPPIDEAPKPVASPASAPPDAPAAPPDAKPAK